MTADPTRAPSPAVEPARPLGPRPTSTVAAFVVVLAHATVVLVGLVASVLGLVSFFLTRSGFTPSDSVLLPLVAGHVLGLVLVAGDVVLALRLWRAAPLARAVLGVWMGLGAVVAAAGLVTTLARVPGAGLSFVVPQVVEVLICAGAIVLLRRPTTSAWLGSRSVRPARPGL